MLQATAENIKLIFKRPAGTSRGVLKTKNSWIIRISDPEIPNVVGTGEASIIEGLSPEWSEDYPNILNEFLENINLVEQQELIPYPSMRFGIESALIDLMKGGNQRYFKSDFTENNAGIRINGLIWMGDKDFMLKQIKDKLELGFSCIKLKIGAIDFESELNLLKFIRDQFSADTLELRVDANGAFKADEAAQKLEALAKFDLHSIEQPIAPKQWKELAELCKNTPLPIALDEELIGIDTPASKQRLLGEVQPQYIILKPSLVGGFQSSDEWISAAEAQNTGWWITSALESNIGLNAIAQYTATKNNPMPQGLGTGSLFENNIESNLRLAGEMLLYQK